MFNTYALINLLFRKSIIYSKKMYLNNENLNFIRSIVIVRIGDRVRIRSIWALMGDFFPSQGRFVDSTAIKRYSEWATYANRGYNIFFYASHAILLVRQAMIYHLQKKGDLPVWDSTCFPTRKLTQYLLYLINYNRVCTTRAYEIQLTKIQLKTANKTI